MSMKIEKMETSSFWKGEAGVKGLVEDQAHTYKVQLYLKNDQVRDYSCTCAEGNSYRGICAHGEALFAYYKKYKKEALGASDPYFCLSSIIASNRISGIGITLLLDSVFTSISCFV